MLGMLAYNFVEILILLKMSYYLHNFANDLNMFSLFDMCDRMKLKVNISVHADVINCTYIISNI